MQEAAKTDPEAAAKWEAHREYNRQYLRTYRAKKKAEAAGKELKSMKLYDMSTPKGIGKWGYMRMVYLRDFRQDVFTELVRRGTLQEHLRMIDTQARERMETLMEQGARHRGITEELKKCDQMEWVRQMNNLQHSAEENVKHDLIYC